MPMSIDDACDMLRGRVRRIAGKDGQRRLKELSKCMHISAPVLLNFMNDTANPTIDTLRTIEAWCDTQEKQGA